MRVHVIVAVLLLAAPRSAGPDMSAIDRDADAARPPGTACAVLAVGIVDYAAGGSGGIPTDRLLAEARRQLDARSGDDVVLARGATSRRRTYVLHRDGLTVRSADYMRDAGGWFVRSVYECNP